MWQGDFASQVSVGMPHQGIQHPVFSLSHSEVVWDEEPQQLDGEMDDPLEHKQAVFTAPIICNGDIEGVSDDLPNQVVWDKETPREHALHNNILWDDSKQVAESTKGNLCTQDIVWDEMAGVAMLWDEMPASNDLHDDLLLQLACGGVYSDENTKLAMKEKLTGEKPKCNLVLHNNSTWPSDQCEEVFPEMQYTVVWDEELSSCFDSNDDLVQQLVFGGNATDDMKIGLIAELDAGVGQEINCGHQNMIIIAGRPEKEDSEQKRRQRAVSSEQRVRTYVACRQYEADHGECILEAPEHILGNRLVGVLTMDNVNAEQKGFTLLMQCSMDAKESLLAILLIIRPWDPGICHAVAWGQATFCEGGSVTPVDSVYGQQGPPVRLGERRHIGQPTRTQRHRAIESEIRSGFAPFLGSGGSGGLLTSRRPRRWPREHLPVSIRPSTSRPGLHHRGHGAGRDTA